MKLKGILDFSLGNFLCLRGFAPMGILQDISQASEDYQREADPRRLKDIGKYLRKGELVFFPEVILCVALNNDEKEPEAVSHFYELVKSGQASKVIRFANGLRISSTVAHSRKADDIRAVQFFQMGTIQFDQAVGKIFSRIDGNHRLSASEDEIVRERTTPFCIIFCRNNVEYRRFSRALFHNINYKQVPLSMEHNLRLILDGDDLFPDKLLLDDPSFGWPYYHARKLHGKLDFDYLPHIAPFIKKEPRTFLLSQFQYLIDNKVLNDNENAITRFKDALLKINHLLDARPILRESSNPGMLAALIYFSLTKNTPISSFSRWIEENHLQHIEKSDGTDFIEIFKRILESRKRTIFVSMPYGKEVTENHFMVIERVAREISNEYELKPALKVIRVDFLQSGKSFPIRSKIEEFMANCGLLLGDLTYCNPNVYHEIGFMDGKAKAKGDGDADVLLFLDESVREADKFVGFNLRGTKHIPFKKSEEFGKLLKENLERFFKLK